MEHLTALQPALSRYRKMAIHAQILSLSKPIFSIIVVLGLLAFCASQNGPGRPIKETAVQSYSHTSLSFEPNLGQSVSDARFISRGQRYNVFLKSDEADIVVAGSKQRTESQNISCGFRMSLVGTRENANSIAMDEVARKSNYFVGSNPGKWRTNVPNYSKVKFEDIFPGVDLIYHGEEGLLEHDFVVSQGADPDVIAFELNLLPDAQTPRHKAKPVLRVDSNGDLLVRSDCGEARFSKPKVYQHEKENRESTSSSRTYREGHYILKASCSASNPALIGFKIGAYDKTRSLVIDPVFSYSTYLGGSQSDFGTAIAVDSSGNAYVAGATLSADFPSVQGAFQKSYGGSGSGIQNTLGDAFVAKLNATGSDLIYSTYLGGSGDDNPYGIAIDSVGNVYLSGGTTSPDFPVTAGAYQQFFGGFEDAFVTKLNATGSALVFSTYLGTSGGGERGFAIAVDNAGSAYVTGDAAPDFPTTPGAFRTIYDGGANDVFVTKFNPAGSALVYSTFLGGSNEETSFSIAVDSAGEACVAGRTLSPDFPTTPDAFQRTLAGGFDGFVTILNAAGSGLMYSSYLGGTQNELRLSIAVDSSDAVYVSGGTSSPDFPITTGAFQSTYGGGFRDAFVAKIDPKQSGAQSLVFSTFLGGGGDDDGEAFPQGLVIQSTHMMAVDKAKNVYITGGTSSDNFPLASPLQSTRAGGVNAYVTKLNSSGSAIIFSTYLGGRGGDSGRAIAVDPAGNVYVTGYTSSADFPTTSGSFQTNCGTDSNCNGVTDAFVTKIMDIILPVANVSPMSVTFPAQVVGVSGTAQSINLKNQGDAPLVISGTTAGSDFTTNNGCPASVTPGTSCTIAVVFDPTASGLRKGTFSISDNAFGSPHMVAVSGMV